MAIRFGLLNKFQKGNMNEMNFEANKWFHFIFYLSFECLAACKQTINCTWFTHVLASELCILYDTCPGEMKLFIMFVELLRANANHTIYSD